MSRLATIGDGTNTYASYKYLGAGRIVVEDFETLGVKLDYAASNFAAWDRFGRVVDQIWLDYGANPDAILDEFTYTYNRAGNRLTRGNALHTAFSETYTYDDLDRLISSARNDSHDQSWGLDGLGNFGSFTDDALSQTRTANAANEITGISGSWADPTYDAAGNMTSAPKPGTESTRIHLRYDAWNHLVAVFADDPLNPGTPGDLIASYEFDGVNRRIEKVVAGTSHVHYFYNHDWQLLEEIYVDGEGVPLLTNQYVWSQRYIDAPIVRYQDGNADGDYLDAGDNVRYYLSDANFNTTAVVDAGTGDVMARYVYDPYGKVTVYSSTWTSPSAPVADGVLYCGYFLDAESGFDNVRHREYVTSVSAWAQRDPIGYLDVDNLYVYVSSRPVDRIDPSGATPSPWGGLDYRPQIEDDPSYRPPSCCCCVDDLIVNNTGPIVGPFTFDEYFPGQTSHWGNDNKNLGDYDVDYSNGRKLLGTKFQVIGKWHKTGGPVDGGCRMTQMLRITDAAVVGGYRPNWFDDPAAQGYDVNLPAGEYKNRKLGSGRRIGEGLGSYVDAPGLPYEPSTPEWKTVEWATAQFAIVFSSAEGCPCSKPRIVKFYTRWCQVSIAKK
jgi:RHS repeat-associated protein